MIFIYVFTLAAILVVASVWQYKRKFNVWQKQGLKGPRPLPLLGNFHRMIFKPIFQVDFKDFQDYGSIYGSYTAHIPVLMVNDADIIKQITIKDAHIFSDRSNFNIKEPIFRKFLSTMTGEDWRAGRKVVTPTFTTGKLKKMYNLMDICANEALNSFDQHAKIEKDVDLKTFWGHYTLNVIARCCFAAEVNAYEDPNSQFIKHVRRFFEPNMLKFAVALALPPKLVEYLRINPFPVDTIDFFCDVTDHLLKKRRENGNHPVDYLQLLIDAKEEAEKEDGKLAEVIDDYFIKAQAMLFFSAGYETTASLLTFGSYTLATQPQTQQTLYNAVSNIKRQEDGTINYDDLMSCKYLDAFVSETLRRYPPLVRIERVASEDYVIPGHNIFIPKGAQVSFSSYATHHDPRYYSDPFEFKLERFLPENASSLVPHTYLAFGSGPRNCVAMRFALLEAKLALAKSLLHYEFVRCPRTEEKVEFVPGGGLLKAKSVTIGVRKR